MYYLLTNFANSMCLDIAESTTSASGYPENLRYCLFGFENIAEAEDAANELQELISGEFKNVSVVIRHFRKRDGWHLWQRQSTAYSMYDLTIDLEDNQVPYYRKDADDWIRERAEILSDGDYLYQNKIDVETFNHNTQKVYDAIKNLNDGQFLIIDNWSWADGYFEILQESAMGYREDVWTHEIGISIE